MLQLRKGRYLCRAAKTSADLAAVFALRKRCFAPYPEVEAGPAYLSAGDSYDARCTQILVEDLHSATLVCCFRLMHLPTAASLPDSYSAQFYDLAALAQFQGPMLEIGRFCLHPDDHAPDILRMAWGALTQWVDSAGVRLLFGCSSFAGDDPALHVNAFRVLHAKHAAPKQWMPQPKAPEVFDFTKDLGGIIPESGPIGLPPLLRTYLLMGGWVSDHAVFDRQLRTMHVFTGVEIAAIPPARARLLRAIAG
ncbi:GNAT family N-acetyltransferase [Pseudorhodobacter sp. W20_MBD10_FR17]|uniref:GNAT family N-acetyltransferase n=1 Tax=Pseudorhodobacter sp. W20_MBD10_FR17 TaxID=3240266 RepID=UPI003F972B1B